MAMKEQHTLNYPAPCDSKQHLLLKCAGGHAPKYQVPGASVNPQGLRLHSQCVCSLPGENNECHRGAPLLSPHIQQILIFPRDGAGEGVDDRRYMVVR